MAPTARILLPARSLRPVPGATYLRPRRVIQRRGFAAEAPQASQANAGGSGAVVGGLVGGVTVSLLGYGWYHFSGTKEIVSTAQQTKGYIDSAFKGHGIKAPEPNQAIQWLRETVNSYAKFIPGAAGYVDTAFDDIEKIQKNHEDEVNSIINETYSELKEVTKAGASVAAATKAWEVVQKAVKRITSLAGDAAGDILDNHPELKDKVGGQYKKLQQMGEQYGPEAKKQVEDVIKQVQDIVKEGLNKDSIGKVQKLVEEKSKELKKMGDEAWKKGLEKAKPVLDKNPELKKTVEENKDKLLQGDLGKLWQLLQDAAKSGNTDDVQKFIKEQVEKGKEQGSAGMEQILGMIPGGGDIGKKFQQLSELSQKHGKEAEKLVKSALDDVKKVLEKKVEEGQQLKNKVEKDAKSS